MGHRQDGLKQQQQQQQQQHGGVITTPATADIVAASALPEEEEPTAPPQPFVLRLAARFVTVLFFGCAYVPFCMSVLLHSFVTRKPIKPCAWALPEMSKWWYSALALFVITLAYTVIAPLSATHGDNLVAPWVWPLLAGSIFFHVLTIDYVHQRAELCSIEKASVVRWRKPLNWMLCLKPLVEFLQLCSVAARVEWLPPNAGGRAFEKTFLDGLERTLFLFDADLGNFLFSAVVVGAFAMMVGENIYAKHSVNSLPGLVLYEGLAGFMFLIIFASLLRLASTARSGLMTLVLVGLLLYTTPAIFVSIYRGDQVERSNTDINYAPLQVCRERVAKEVWAIFVSLLAHGTTARLVAVVVLAFLLLLTLFDTSQYSACAVVRVRRALLLTAAWVALSALFVVHGHADVGRTLLLVGLSTMLGLALLAAASWLWFVGRHRGSQATDAPKEILLQELPVRSSAPVAAPAHGGDAARGEAVDGAMSDRI